MINLLWKPLKIISHFFNLLYYNMHSVLNIFVKKWSVLETSPILSIVESFASNRVFFVPAFATASEA